MDCWRLNISIEILHIIRFVRLKESHFQEEASPRCCRIGVKYYFNFWSRRSNCLKSIWKEASAKLFGHKLLAKVSENCPSETVSLKLDNQKSRNLACIVVGNPVRSSWWLIVHWKIIKLAVGWPVFEIECNHLKLQCVVIVGLDDPFTVLICWIGAVFTSPPWKQQSLLKQNCFKYWTLVTWKLTWWCNGSLFVFILETVSSIAKWVWN